MTILAADNTRAICRIQLKREGRWVSLALSIGGTWVQAIGSLCPPNASYMRWSG